MQARLGRTRVGWLLVAGTMAGAVVADSHLGVWPWIEIALVLLFAEGFVLLVTAQRIGTRRPVWRSDELGIPLEVFASVRPGPQHRSASWHLVLLTNAVPPILTALVLLAALAITH